MDNAEDTIFNILTNDMAMFKHQINPLGFKLCLNKTLFFPMNLHSFSPRKNDCIYPNAFVIAEIQRAITA